MIYLHSLVDKTIELEISGHIERVGFLIDYGPDLIVIFDGANYVYIPTGHIQNIKLVRNSSDQITSPSMEHDNIGDLSLRKILTHSKGMFVQVYVTGNQSIYGYVTQVMSNYFVFYSPIHKILYIPLFHLKWLIPYPENLTPFTLNKDELPIKPSQLRHATMFEEQLKKMEGKVVVFDLGTNPDKIGLLKTVQHNMAELITAEQKTILWNIHHIKLAHFPDL